MDNERIKQEAEQHLWIEKVKSLCRLYDFWYIERSRKGEKTMLGKPYCGHYFYFIQYMDKVFVESHVGSSYRMDEYRSVKCPIENKNDLVRLFAFYGLDELMVYCRDLK